MSKFAVVARVKDRHWDAFHALLGHRQTTAKGAAAWLAQRGYRIGKSSVQRYIQSLATAGRSQANGTAADRERALKRLWAAVRGMAAMELEALALYAAFLATRGGSSKGGGRR